MAASNRSTLEASGAHAPIQLNDLAAQQKRLRPQIDAAIAKVLDHGRYIMGPEVAEFEERLAAYSGAHHVVSCSSGTDALLMCLMARGIGPGDAVVCPAFTYTATPEVIALLGATAVFVDVHADTFNIDADRLDDAAAAARQAGLNLRAIIAVDLFGQPADYAALEAFAEHHGLFLVCDAAQSFGASLGGRKVGTFGHATTTSFFPAKPLGCYGDGGAILTNDETLADAVRSIRLHGKGAAKYDVVRIGINGRLDTIQAAILLQKLTVFDDEIARRNVIAERYTRALGKNFEVPRVIPGAKSVWAQYTLRMPQGRRDALAGTLKDAGIATAVYYPRPLHKQPAYADHIVPAAGLTTAERLCDEALSLPMHAHLTDAQVDRVIAAIGRSVRR